MPRVLGLAVGSAEDPPLFLLHDLKKQFIDEVAGVRRIEKIFPLRSTVGRRSTISRPVSPDERTGFRRRYLVWVKDGSGERSIHTFGCT